MKARLYKRNFGDHADDLIRQLPCATCESPPPSDPSHTVPRGRGGDKRSLVPQCRMCHIEYEGNQYTGSGYRGRNGRTHDDLVGLAAQLWKITLDSGIDTREGLT